MSAPYLCECGATAPAGTPGWHAYAIGGGWAEACPRCFADLDRWEREGPLPGEDFDADAERPLVADCWPLTETH